MPALVAGIRVFFWAWRCAAWAKSAATRRGAPDFELATGASSRRLPTLLPNDQKKRRLRVRRRQNLAAPGYGCAHAHSILSMALREFSNEIRLYGDWRWEP